MKASDSCKIQVIYDLFAGPVTRAGCLQRSPILAKAIKIRNECAQSCIASSVAIMIKIHHTITHSSAGHNSKLSRMTGNFTQQPLSC
jgi:hypothetical protein